ncbi:hypothetical protein PMI42_06242 [Bradyrhizobium sp. YR681]|uniref:hypothetical protein n=1 Tax=Bradyrhizobium sp. YR681 TaxID=1144344 RepID=UPI00026FB9F8|nr:hypothetical protein [Bradyrhizobium sp. YR681]EJN10466.1 hypothetical protein PMI42_06242 [Bradyrhizobium sp. YR681]
MNLLLLATTIWYLVITPIPTGDAPDAKRYRTFEVESAEFPTKADCQQFGAQRGQAELDKVYPPTGDQFTVASPAIVGAFNCFSRVRP